MPYEQTRPVMLMILTLSPGNPLLDAIYSFQRELANKERIFGGMSFSKWVIFKKCGIFNGYQASAYGIAILSRLLF